MNTTKIRKLLLVFVCVALPLLILLYNAYFSGSRSGIVLDSRTQRPIQGAIVEYHWPQESPLGRTSGGAHFETTTDENGRYFIPNQRHKRNLVLLVFGTIRHEEILVYKPSYAAYIRERDKSSTFYGHDQTYHKHNNVVLLDEWQSCLGKSHKEHLRYIYQLGGGGPLLDTASDYERHMADEELQTQKDLRKK